MSDLERVSECIWADPFIGRGGFPADMKVDTRLRRAVGWP